RTARWRIKQAAALLPQLQQLRTSLEQAGLFEAEPTVDPMTGEAGMKPVSVGQQLFGALTPPFNPRERGPMESAEYLSTWLTTDEGLNAPSELIEFVGVLQDIHLQAQALQQMALGAVSMAGQPMPPEQQGGKPGEKEKPANKPPGPQAQGGALA